MRMQFSFIISSIFFAILLPLSSTRPAEIQNAFDVEESETVQVCDETNSKNWFIYCSGRMIEAAMSLHLYADSKTYTDRPLLRPPGDVLKDFNEQFPEGQEIIKEDLQAFMDKNFAGKDDELELCELKDWSKNPPLINTIRDESMRKWALSLNGIWKDLCRKIKKEVQEKPDQYSLLYVPNQFIVPGGRFKEYYYWDAYWIVKGLLASGMIQSVKDMISNLVHLVENHGFIPNGGRVYYLRRSQPPFLIPMVYDYYEATGDIAFVNEILPTLEKELNFWYENRQTNVTLVGEDVQVFQYRSASNVPRPESYREDMLLVKNVNDVSEKRKIWRDLASAAESGWDFSSRWFGDLHNLSTIETSNVAPVDLNAFMCGNLNILSFLFRKTGSASKAEGYQQKFEDFKNVFQKVFYNEKEMGWYDYNLRNRSHNVNFYPSMITPLFTNCYHSLDVSTIEDMFENMERKGAFKYKGGVPSSLLTTDQQWDFPNGWSPSNHMVVEGLRKSDSPKLQQKAFEIAEKWVLSNYFVYTKTSNMWEKYNVNGSYPDAGSGGEYIVQSGFGWTNGAILDLLITYSDRMYFPQLNQVVAESKTIGEIQSQMDEIQTAPSMAQIQLDVKMQENNGAGNSAFTNFKFIALILCVSKILLNFLAQ